MDEDINGRIIEFKSKILEYSDTEMIKYCFDHLITPVCMTSEQYFDLRLVTAHHFGLDSADVLMVGSGRLGFSIKPGQQFRHFCDRSDVDLAIISDELFEYIWKRVFEYKNSVRYWPRENEFKNYLFKGWIRPDLLPPSQHFSVASEWWEFFRGVTNSGKYGFYQVRAGLYHSRYFFESYQKTCMVLCRNIVSEGV